MAVSAYTILKPDPIFPGPDDPSGKPEDWTLGEMRKWLSLVRDLWGYVEGGRADWCDAQRGLEPAGGATRAELLERIKLNMRAAPVMIS